MNDFIQHTVVQLKQYLKHHKLPTTGKKAVLLKRCERHALTCKCLQPFTLLPEHGAVAVDTSISLTEMIKTVTWTDSLKEFPQINHSTIHSFKASDKHVKQGYNLFKCGKVENLLVGNKDDSFYCKGRVSPSMKKIRYLTILKFFGTVVIESDCSCPAGKGKCKHAIAMLYSIVDHIMSSATNISPSLACTEQPRQWGRASAKPVECLVKDFSELAPQVVSYNPDEPHSSAIQAERAENQLRFSCLPSDTLPVHTTRKDILTAFHPFWRGIITDSSLPQLESFSSVRVTSLNANSRQGPFTECYVYLFCFAPVS